jgi:hypothetical protein
MMELFGDPRWPATWHGLHAQQEDEQELCWYHDQPDCAECEGSGRS